MKTKSEIVQKIILLQSTLLIFLSVVLMNGLTFQEFNIVDKFTLPLYFILGFTFSIYYIESIVTHIIYSRIFLVSLVVVLIGVNHINDKTESLIIINSGYAEMYENPIIRNSEEVMTEILKEKTSIENYSVGDFIRAVSKVYGIDGNLIIAQYDIESGFNRKAKSSMGAIGIAQLMPVVYRDTYDIDPWDPIQNMIVGIRYHAYLDSIFADLPEPHRTKFILAAYNAGPSKVMNLLKLSSKYNEISYYLPNETRKYVNKVLDKYETLKPNT